jgi:diacylglycerol O-acyltransferase
MDRLSSLDASFLRAETASAHMHVGWLALVEPPPGSAALDPGLLRSRIAARLDLAPRFRQRVVEVPVGDPALVDDPGFSVERHVRSTPDSAPLSPAELQETLDAFLSAQLSRSIPLWEILIVPRLTGGGGAILGKVHHALVDGVAAVELGMLLFDLEPDTAPAQAPQWSPELPPSPVRLALSSATDSALDQFRAAGRMANLGLQPSRGLRVADSMRRAAFAMAREIAEPAPSSYLNGPIGPERTLLTSSLPLERVLAIKQRTASKLNEVVLAIVSGALHSFSAERQASPAPLRAMIPINVRGAAGGGAAGDAEGNRIAFGFLELPVASADPLTRLRSIRTQSAALRDSERARGREAIMHGVGLLPGPVKSLATRVASSSRTFNLTVSNVPGPRVPLYAAGGEVRSIYPVIPLAGSHALAVGVLTYGGDLHVALHTDPGRLPEAGVLPGLFEAALDELDRATRSPGGRGGTPRPGPRGEDRRRDAAAHGRRPRSVPPAG